MDRTDEFASLLKVYGYDDWLNRADLLPQLQNPEFASISFNIANSIRTNDNLLKRIEKLYVLEFASTLFLFVV